MVPFVWWNPERLFFKYPIQSKITTITTARQRNYNFPSVPLPSPPERRGWLRIGAFNPYSSLLELCGVCSGGFCSGVLAGASPPRKSRLGGLKEARGGRCAASIASSRLYLRNTHYSCRGFAFFIFSLFPPSTSKKQKTYMAGRVRTTPSHIFVKWAKIFPHQNFYPNSF